MMFVGTTIDNMVVGGPAYNSQQLSKGDVLLAVDDVDVDGDNMHDLLIGNDVPGSTVKLTVSSAGSGLIKQVMLVRMPTTAIADLVRMFQVFTALKDQALNDDDKFVLSLLDEAIELWTGTLMSQADRGNAMQNKVLAMQFECQQLLGELKVLLNEVHVRGSAANPAAAFRIGTDLYKHGRLSQRKPDTAVPGGWEGSSSVECTVPDGDGNKRHQNKATLDDDMFIDMIYE